MLEISQMSRESCVYVCKCVHKWEVIIAADVQRHSGGMSHSALLESLFTIIILYYKQQRSWRGGAVVKLSLEMQASLLACW